MPQLSRSLSSTASESPRWCSIDTRRCHSFAERSRSRPNGQEDSAAPDGEPQKKERSIVDIATMLRSSNRWLAPAQALNYATFEGARVSGFVDNGSPPRI